MQRDAWDRGKRFCKLAELIFCLLRQQPGGQHWGQLRKCVTPSGDRMFSGKCVCGVAPRWDPHNVELEAITEAESGGFLEEAVHSAAAAATLAEGAECDGCPLSQAPFDSGDHQRREAKRALSISRRLMRVSLGRKREEGFPR